MRNPNDLLSFILITLHKELNTKQNVNNENQNIDIYNQNAVINAGSQNFKNSNDSVVSNLLNWFEIKQSQCTGCSLPSYNFYTFNTFELDLLGTSKNNMGNLLNINACLEYYRRTRKQKLFCQKCKQFKEIFYCSNIFKAPNILIFSLNRGDLKDQNNELVKIQFLLEENINILNTMYHLTGIVSLFWQNNKLLFGSFCKSPYDQQWYYYFNTNIQNTSINNILQLHNNNQYIPCILEYERISGQ